ncbi:MAG TPA: twin-arginine translocase TatA/TatE family subunit [Pyrinomonadaceae bacterium]|jgi:sec-independent protein translocase protein TatA|nr:twin-arginine translocase TatA/TatE family subunit [Pyrinomonadaceae bacterium]
MMNKLLLLGMPGGWEWIIILVVILLLFGGSRLPQLAKALGQSKRAFQEGQDEADKEAKLEEARRRERLNAAETIEEDRVASDRYAKESKR